MRKFTIMTAIAAAFLWLGAIGADAMTGPGPTKQPRRQITRPSKKPPAAAMDAGAGLAMSAPAIGGTAGAVPAGNSDGLSLGQPHRPAFANL